GLLNEFKLAQANLQANRAAGKGKTFAYTGAGTSPLPITLAFFSGRPASDANTVANYTSTNFTNATFLNALAVNNPNVCCGTSSYAGALDNNGTFRDNAFNRTKGNLEPNLFLTN